MIKFKKNILFINPSLYLYYIDSILILALGFHIAFSFQKPSFLKNYGYYRSILIMNYPFLDLKALFLLYVGYFIIAFIQNHPTVDFFVRKFFHSVN